MQASQRRIIRRALGVVALGRARVAALATLLFAGPVAIHAQSTTAPSFQAAGDGHLRLGELYAAVERVNPRLTVARALTHAANARVPGATRPPDPQVQLGFMNYMVPDLAPMASLGMRQLQVMQMLPLGGKLALSGRVAGARASAVAERAQEVTWELRSETAMSFYDLYAVDRRLDVMRETVRLLQDIEKTAAAMYRVGEGRQSDVLRAQVEIAKMVEDTVRMQAMRAGMVARLNALLDRATETPVGTPVLPAFPETPPDRAALDSIARLHRPMIRAALDEVRAAEAAEQLARKEIWPDLQVGAQYGQRGGDMGGTEHMGSLMVGASVPIFARSRQYRMRDEMNAMVRMAQADVTQMRADTRGKLGEAFANLVRARNLATLYRATVLPQAQASVASALAAYRVGSVDFMTLLDSQMTVNEFRQELHALDAEQGKAWAELEMLTGRTLLDANRLSATPRGDK